MERLWADLTQADPSFDSPHGHEPILRDREAALAGGTMGVSDWEEAKERIRRNVACK
ncbi:addiction module protein [Methylococcus capsulatus]|uniref:addiction module protein n=2 Tax=Methylococcaceae TaxID=403 RepID=UPI003CC82C7F